MKKIGYMILTFIISLCLFIDKGRAYQSSDIVMASSCKIDENCPENSNCYENDEEDDSRTYIVRYTDNLGNGFLSLKNGPGVFVTKENYIWLSGATYAVDENAKILPESTFDDSYCPASIGMAPGTLDFFSIIGGPIVGGFKVIKNAEFVIKNNGASVVFHDTKSSVKSAKLEHSRYIIYQYNNKKNVLTIAEGYNSKGEYAFVGQDITKTFVDEIVDHQRKLIEYDSYVGLDKYFKIDEVYAARLIAGNGNDDSDIAVCEGKSETRCESENGYKVLVSSARGTDGYKNMENAVSKWIDGNNDKFTGYNNIIAVSKDTSFINTCEDIKESNENNEEYDFKKISNMNTFIEKVETGYTALEEAYNVSFEDCGPKKETSPVSSAVSCVVYSDILGINEIVDLAEKNDKEHVMNAEFLVSAIYSDVTDIITEQLESQNYNINVIDASRDLNKYTELFYTAASYINSRAKRGTITLTEDQQQRIEAIITNFEKLVKTEKLGIYPVVDCETLLGQDLIDKIKSYTNIIKIAIPIILIGFGIFDFTKAVFAGEDEMKKAQTNFIKRIGIAVLIFLTPSLVHLLLLLANKVWSVISPDSCGIF